MLKIPYALADFNELRHDDCFYIDRTGFIEQLELHGTRYPMFLRPRRFGKSLFISILEHYYDVDKASDFQKLFGNLYIGQNPTPLANQFLILRFDFSGIETQDVRKVHDAFLKKVKDGFLRFTTTYKTHFQAGQFAAVEAEDTPAGAALIFFGLLSKNDVLATHKIYLLIDEYDQFTNELLSFHFSDFKDIVSKNGYVRKFYEVLKEKAMFGFIARIFMTGVAPVTVDSMTSGFNIMTDISLHPLFHDMMGFTEAEVDDLLRQLNLSDTERAPILTDLRNWYDGYRFDVEIMHHLYNPEMVLYFANYYQSMRRYPKKMLTSNVATDYKKIANIFRIGNQESIALSYLNQFLEKGEIKSYLTEQFNIELGFTISDIWSMLFYSGMTTIKAVLGNNYTFQMPNYVIKSLYYDYLMALQLGMSYGNLRHEIRDSIEQLVMQGEIEPFTKYIAQVIAHEHSNRDSIGYNEKHLKTLVIGLLFPYEGYLIRSEIEHQRRFIDIFLEKNPSSSYQT